MLRPLRFLPLFLILSTAVFAGERPVSRPGVLHLTHEAAMQMALAKNFAIQVQRFAPQVAEQRVRSAWGEFDPLLSAKWDRDDNTRRNQFVDSRLQLARSSSRTDDWNVGFGGLTPWGLRYDLGLGTTTSSGTATSGDDRFATSTRLGIEQPLLRGFGPAANLDAVRIARNNAFASEWAFRQQIIDTLTETDFVYNDLHFALENLKVAERSRALALQLYSDNEARLKIGVKSPLDVTEARAEAAAREEAVILARRVVRDNENLLKQLVTNDLESMLSIQVEIEPPPSPAFAPDVPLGINDALGLRPDYQQAVLVLKNRNVTLAFQRNATLPRFDLTGSLELLGLGTNFGSSVERTPRRDQTIWTVGAVVSIPIPNREALGNEAAARLQVAQQMVELKRLEQKIVVDVDNASGQVVTSRERIVSNEEARRLARESLDAGEERLKAGVGTTFVVLELQAKLAVAEAAEIRARADYNKAISEYYRQTGTSLRVYNVNVQ